MASFPSSHRPVRGTTRIGAVKGRPGYGDGQATLAGGGPPPGGLAAVLHALGDTLDRDLGERLVADGWPEITPTRLRLLEHAAPLGVDLPALSRVLGVTRQAVHQLVTVLERDGLVAMQDDRGDRRARTIALTDQGRRLVGAARAHRAELERNLERRLGAEGSQALESWFALVRSVD